jgi:TetR/AcrR family transcriptional regulator
MHTAFNTNTAQDKGRLGSRHQPEQTRAAILEAAMREFAMEGVAGARTDEIARSAGVNKALLYYYFKDKESLFGAVLDALFKELTTTITEAIERGKTPTEKFLGYLGAHFDFVASSPLRPRLFQREMMRSGRNGSRHLKHIVDAYLRPTFGRVAQLIAEGIKSGEFRPVDPAQFVPSVIGVVVFYFATPVPTLMTGVDPFAPEQVARRKAAVIDFVSTALFRDARGCGLEHAETCANEAAQIAASAEQSSEIKSQVNKPLSRARRSRDRRSDAGVTKGKGARQ